MNTREAIISFTIVLAFIAVVIIVVSTAEEKTEPKGRTIFDEKKPPSMTYEPAKEKEKEIIKYIPNKYQCTTDEVSVYDYQTDFYFLEFEDQHLCEDNCKTKFPEDFIFECRACRPDYTSGAVAKIHYKGKHHLLSATLWNQVCKLKLPAKYRAVEGSHY